MNTSDYFESYDASGNESLEYAKKVMITVLDLCFAEQGKFKEPLLIGMQGNPGLGKSHLIESLKSGLLGVGLDFSSNKNDDHFLMMERYKDKNIIIIDDFLKDYQHITDIKSPTDKILREQFTKLIFNVYDNKKLLLISSNFSLQEIENFMTKEEDQHSRLKSRFNHLKSHAPTIKMEGKDYREILAEKGGGYSALFKLFSS